ncbi:MAG: FHA domain-containing protein [Roseiflexaceae bacterium]
MYPQIYLGDIPTTSDRRRAVRALALDIRARIHATRAVEPTTLLLHFRAGESVLPAIDLLLLRLNAAIIGAIRDYHGPIESLPDGQWRHRDSGELLREERDRTPIQHVKLQRDAVRAQLDAAAPRLLGTLADAHPFDRTVGALIIVPSTHAESKVSLEIGDHRQQIKLLGLDELPALAGMLRLGVQLPEPAIQAIVSELFGGQLWHDGAHFLFELATPRFQLHLLGDGARPEKLLPLIEGENLLGRRRSSQHYEHRLTLAGDELISADHALIICGDDDWAALRDISKNGTWITPPGGTEERVRGERTIFPGTLLRMGMTRALLERVEE